MSNLNEKTFETALKNYNKDMIEYVAGCPDLESLEAMHSELLESAETYLNEGFQPTEIGRIEGKYMRQDLEQLSIRLQQVSSLIYGPVISAGVSDNANTATFFVANFRKSAIPSSRTLFLC